MENIAPIQIAELKREKRVAVTAAYRRGYADALEDMRKRQREKKRRLQYFIIQKRNGVALLAFTALAVYILEGDANILLAIIALLLVSIWQQLKEINERGKGDMSGEREKKRNAEFRGRK